MMHVPSPSDPLIHSLQRSVRQRPPVFPAEQTWAQLLAVPRTPSFLRSQLQACALIILVPGFLGQQGALLTWLPPERMPWSELLPGYSLVVEDDRLEGNPQGVIVLTAEALCSPPATALGSMSLTHACFRAIPYFRRPQLLTRR
jgi:hypothetical protein